MKNNLLVVGAFILGAVVSGFVTKYRYDEAMMWGLYIQAASEVNGTLVALSELREGKKERAIHLLDQSLASEASVLAGCKRDLCQDNAYPEFTRALEEVRAYQQKYLVK